MQKDSLRIAFRWRCSCLVMMQRYLRYDHIDICSNRSLQAFLQELALTRCHKVILPLKGNGRVTCKLKLILEPTTFLSSEQHTTTESYRVTVSSSSALNMFECLLMLCVPLLEGLRNACPRVRAEGPSFHAPAQPNITSCSASFSFSCSCTRLWSLDLSCYLLLGALGQSFL